MRYFFLILKFLAVLTYFTLSIFQFLYYLITGNLSYLPCKKRTRE